MNPKEVEIVIYHYPCPDGLASAWVAKKYSYLNNVKYEYVGIMTNSSPTFTSKLTEQMKGKTILFIDYAPTKGQYLIAKELAKEIYILDHHKTNEAEYKDKENTVFDMNKSGVGLAWDFFFPNQEMPVYLQMVQERDLWKFTIPNTREFTNGLYFSAGEDLDNYTLVMDSIYQNPSTMQDYVKIGTAIENNKQEKIKKMVEYNKNNVYTYNGFRCGIINCDYDLASDLGNAMMLTNNFDFVVLWRYDHPKELYILSFRSTEKSNFDVSELAKSLGGGGHFCAAGASIKEHPSVYFSK
jgi:oligoribonuclease NrnB/cAMP/cGMP phosphodiesterase (DHH superfamily)